MLRNNFLLKNKAVNYSLLTILVVTILLMSAVKAEEIRSLDIVTEKNS